MTAVLVKRAHEAQQATSVPHIDKWSVFHDLCTARLAFGLSDRDLTVLNALLSFHQGNSLSDNENLIVFPSNRKLSVRAHGMAESTLRRHLAALSHAGVIQRHDSPNGKRYAARGATGDVTRAFGFDLRPLLVQAQNIASAAAETLAAADRLRRTREEVVLIKRDALKLCMYGQENGAEADWPAIEQQLLNLHKQLRRKLDIDTLTSLVADARQLLVIIQTALKTDKTDGSDDNSERHHQNSNKDLTVSELCLEKTKGDGDHPDIEKPEPSIPLALVLKACPEILPYATEEIRHWHQLVALAGFVRGMMGISIDAWRDAQNNMGPEVAAITVAAILQRVDDIKSPGGYLRALSRKAEAGGFSIGPMVMALLNAKG